MSRKSSEQPFSDRKVVSRAIRDIILKDIVKSLLEKDASSLKMSNVDKAVNQIDAILTMYKSSLLMRVAVKAGKAIQTISQEP